MKRLEYLVIRAITGVLSILPLTIARRGADGIAFLVGSVLGIRREVVHQNIRRAFPGWDDERVEEAARDTYRFFARAGISWLKWDAVSRRETIVREGWDRVREYQGKGAILAAGHFGYWELSAALIAEEIGEFMTYADEQSNPYSERWITSIRNRVGVHTVSGAQGTRELVRCVKEGGIVGIIGDQRPRNQPVSSPFFGYEVDNARILPFVARKTQAPVLPGICFREGDHLKMTIGQPFPASLEPVTRDNIPRLARQFNEWLERQIENHPEQYFWLHKRFKNARKLSKEDEE